MIKTLILISVDGFTISTAYYIMMNGIIFFMIYYLFALLSNHYFEKIKWNDSFLSMKDKRMWRYTFMWIIFISLCKFL